MAVINSLAIGKAVKSAGNLTYKVSRGRTIASQRIVSNKSNTYNQQIQRGKFSRAASAMQLISQYIDTFFEPSKYGSARNNFVKKNGLINFGGVLSEIKEGAIPLVEGFVYTFQCGETGESVPGAGTYTSYGSGAFIATAPSAVHRYVGSSSNEIFVRKCQSLSVSPTVGVDLSKIEVRVSGFAPVSPSSPNPPLFVRSITPDTEGIAALEALGLTCTVTTDEITGLVSNVNIVLSSADPGELVGSVYAITVAVSGKIATTAGLWFVVENQPLP